MKSMSRSLIVFIACAGAPLMAHAQVSSSPETAVAVAADAPLLSDAAAAPSAAQPADAVPTPEHTGIRALLVDLWDDVKHIPAKENVWWAIGGGGLALAVHPADTHVTPYLVDASWTHNTFAFGAVLGQTSTLLAASVGTYAVSRGMHSPKAAHVGMDMIQALAMSNLITQTLKYTTARQRPDGSGATSFPSGHAADTFAVATALERHAGWKGALPAYLFASYVAASRLHDNRHYLSDVVFGSAVGIIAGRTVTRHGREIPITIAAVPGGAALLYVRNGK